MTRTVCTVTGTRAEYGLLRPVLRALAREPGVTSRLLVTGAHLAPGHGSTVAAIEADGLAVDERVEVLLDSDTAVGTATSTGLVLIGVAGALARLAPDLLLVLGDRYETLGAALAAHLAGIPVAHLHGGETTAGAVDDAMRHALTKLAALHLVAAEPFARAVEALGEDPARVHIVGAPGLDEVRALDPLPRAALEEDLGVPLRRPTLVLTYHPATLGEPPGAGLDAVLAALDRHPDATVVATHPGAEPGARAVAARLERWAAARPGPTAVHTSLGQRRYLSLVAAADAVVGNSSSGIIEAPALGTPTVDVGERQRGRLRGPSVLHADAEAGAVAAALAAILSPAGQALAAGGGSPYGDGRAAPRIARLLAGAELEGLAAKLAPGRGPAVAAGGGARA
jgi:UDP-hydrolysing UDP-N-acetyl-D-glucosamine 2-epimerase